MNYLAMKINFHSTLAFSDASERTVEEKQSKGIEKKGGEERKERLRGKKVQFSV
jgi:hypothetical protein